MARKVVNARKDDKGNIAAVQLEGNITFTNIEVAKKMVKREEIKGVHVVHRKDGSSYLRTNPDGKEGNNLDEMAKT